ncbi:MAG: carbon-nitrogen family hydrolase [Anaerolineae bacterium]|nr:carbon-nitrogen family hydrolase [Anaerolineae bacterium]
MDIVPGEPDANFAAAAALVEEAAERGSDLVVLPELWDSGFALDRAVVLASAFGEGLFRRVAELARRHRIHVTGSMLEKHGGKVYNCMAVFAPNGDIVGIYRKTHLIGLMGEDQWLAPGDMLTVLDLPWGRTGLALCYDLRFPELFRRYVVDQGARFIILPAAWPLPRRTHWRILTRARAIENQCFLAACNRVGQSGKYEFFGASALIDPWGERLVEAGDVPALLTVTVDMGRVDEVRAALPALADRRSDLYS